MPDTVANGPRSRLRKVDAKLFRRTVKRRGDSLQDLAVRFRVSRAHLYRVLDGETSAPLVAKIIEYIESEAA